MILSGLRNPPPSLSASGALRSRDAHTAGTLTLATSSSWRPLPNRLPELLVPRLDGWMTIDASGASLFAEASVSQPEVFLAANLLVLRRWRVAVTVGLHSDQQVEVNVSGAVAIGGSRGFVANVSGHLDTELEAAHLEVTSDGGWVPFPNVLPNFISPAFIADLYLGGATLISFHETAHSPQPVVVIDGVLQLEGVGAANRATGPSLEVTLSQADATVPPLFDFYLSAGCCVELQGPSRNESCLDTTIRLDDDVQASPSPSPPFTDDPK